MGDMGDIWREVREERRKHLSRVYPHRVERIESLARRAELTLRQMQDAVRVNETVDFYPTRQRFHMLKTGQRGHYGQMTDDQLIGMMTFRGGR